MRIIGIVGSPRKEKGNTGRLMLEVLKSAQQQGATFETVALPGGTVLPCLACDTCHKKGFCPQRDEFDDIMGRIMASDGIVLASPNYIFNVSAQLKAFMDRCCGVIHCLGFEGRYGASVVTSGGGDEAPIAEMMNHFMITTGVTPVGSVWATMGSFEGDEFPDEIVVRARALGRKLVDDWRKKNVPADIAERKVRFAERMRQLMLYRKDEWPYEYQYWQKKNRL
ncbi:flavodoxin family protein [Desulforhopalus singaporensis]|uniref:Multimeric flavodoxin WrbA n=1 Tax=Desulforhopalus singaporensis TaxID=91360 RepID=A0A1H0KTV5_9BACT|nr:flavodoxin family protein [Desulforhopalus singaporensis]SDO59216.1 Multimeric flavodoxin WrbA [Desulforhopalus singaporensis]